MRREEERNKISRISAKRIGREAKRRWVRIEKNIENTQRSITEARTTKYKEKKKKDTNTASYGFANQYNKVVSARGSHTTKSKYSSNGRRETGSGLKSDIIPRD